MRFIKYILLWNVFITNVLGFTNVVSAFKIVRSRSSLDLCSISKMSMDNRRDVLGKPFDILKLSSLSALLGSCVMGIAGMSHASAVPIEYMQDRNDDVSDAWTKHDGVFQEEDLKDFVKTSSGLFYKDVVEGKGDVPNDGDAVTIQMVGYIFETGEKWTNTYKGIPQYQSVVRAGPRENQKYMKGLNEGVASMKRGGKRIIVIPAFLAYLYVTILSENKDATIIPGGSSLVCYVEVIDFGPLKN
jgi:FKBP-type peptidyl-prolyl cis-trans isomerase